MCKVSPKFFFIFVAIGTLSFPILLDLYDESKSFDVGTETVISVVGCGVDRRKEAMRVVKSALMFSPPTDPLKFIIFSEFEQHREYEKSLQNFQQFRNFSYQIFNATFPEDRSETWRNLFRPCSAQKLFLPELLRDIDALLYVDSDVLFLSPPSETFNMFKQFNDSQIAGLVTNALKNDSFYPRDSEIPYYGQFGVNAGVKLMNLTRMRAINYQKQLVDIFTKYEAKLKFMDQDIINIYFNLHPEQMFEMPCEFNFRLDFCWESETSPECNALDGIKILHGNQKAFSDKETVMWDIANFVEKHQLQEPIDPEIIKKLKKRGAEYSRIINKIKLNHH